MRCLIRADATIETGTGHVMRCLTLSEELVRRGHDVVLRGDLGGIGWLRDRVSMASVVHQPALAHTLALTPNDAAEFNAVIVDSYEFNSESVNALARAVPTLAIIDGDHRGLKVDVYLDQNLGAEDSSERRTLAGPRYALVRGDFIERKRNQPRPIGPIPSVLAYMGGSDPKGAIVAVARSLATLPIHIELNLVVAERWRDAVADVVAGRELIRLLHPTPNLAELLADADVVVSASGTSAWEICTVGVPAVFVAVVANQRAGYSALIAQGLGLGIDLSSDISREHDLAAHVRRLIADETLRESIFQASHALFDGQGACRVAEVVEQIARDRATA